MEIKGFDNKKIEELIGEKVESIEQISYGYTNKIYSINGKYILKICDNERNFKNFKRASEFCQKYYGRINCPKIISSNLDIENGDLWQIEEKVDGENLFFKWSSLSKEEKSSVIDKICKALKQIHDIPVTDVFEKNFEPDDWKNKFKKDIEKFIASLREKGIEYDELYYALSQYVDSNLSVLDETNYKVCHSDMHFDNIMIDDNNDITILDYDRLRISSIDYELNIFNVMSKTPEVVANNEAKKHINSEDYKGILEQFMAQYPEMADFSNMDERLNLYAIKHYLGLLKFVEGQEKRSVLDTLENTVRNKEKAAKNVTETDREI